MPHHADQAAVDVPLPGAVDIPQSLEGLRRAGDDGIDRWDGTTLLRTLTVGGDSVAFACTPFGPPDAPGLRVETDDLRYRSEVDALVRATFVHAPPGFADLLRRDTVLARLERLHPAVRPIRQGDLLTALVRAISAQQVNLKWAATTRRRLAEAFGVRHRIAGREVHALRADRLAAADPAEIRALQFTTRKAEYIVGVAGEIARGHLDLAALAGMPDDAVIERLTALRGIGRWTAEWLLARTLGRPRVVAGDLGVRKAVGLAYFGGELPSERAVREATAHWGDSAAVAQGLVLQGLAEGTLPG